MPADLAICFLRNRDLHRQLYWRQPEPHRSVLTLTHRSQQFLTQSADRLSQPYYEIRSCVPVYQKGESLGVLVNLGLSVRAIECQIGRFCTHLPANAECFPGAPIGYARASYASGGGGASRAPRIAGDVAAGPARQLRADGLWPVRGKPRF